MAKYFLGTSGYVYDHWVKRFYPKDLPRSKWLGFYAEHFNSVEINYTYYHFPVKKNLLSWAGQVPDGFVFTIKGNKGITHMKKFSNCKPLVNRFYKTVSVLDEKLGSVLWQLPPFLHFSEKKLTQILGHLNPDFLNVLEFRHESWFNETTFQMLKGAGVAFCCVSVPDLPSTCIKTAPFAYVRFHCGKNSSEYSNFELAAWVRKIRGLRAKRVFAYFNNDDHAYAVKNCLFLKSRLER